eukprot:Em0088g15a
MALAMALTRVIFSLPNMSLITLALRNEEEPKAKRVASRVKLQQQHPTLLLASAKIAGVKGDVTVMSKAAGLVPSHISWASAIQSWSEAMHFQLLTLLQSSLVYTTLFATLTSQAVQ